MQIAQSKSEALDTLYQRYSRLVFSLALNMVSDRAVAEEITLDVFTRVWEKAATYRPEQAQVNTWLVSLTRHRAIDWLRRQRVRLDGASLTWAEVSSGNMPHAAGDPEKAAELALRRERIQAAVAQLPFEQQETLALAYFKGQTHQQIAETLNQPLGTVKTRLRLAMQKLRHLLKDEQIVL